MQNVLIITSLYFLVAEIFTMNFLVCFPTSIHTWEYSSLKVKMAYWEEQRGLHLTVPNYCHAGGNLDVAKTTYFKNTELSKIARNILHHKMYILMTACISLKQTWELQEVFQTGLSYLIFKIKEFYLNSTSIQTTNLQIMITRQWSVVTICYMSD
jgi:hypothetical protein